MVPIEIQLARPYIAFAIALLADYLISTGKIAPEQREAWVQGAIQISSFILGGLLSCIVVWHEFKVLHSKTTKTITTQITEPAKEQLSQEILAPNLQTLYPLREFKFST